MDAQARNAYKILVIDDNLSNVELLFEYLTDAGFEVEKALDGRSGLQKVEEHQPDLILLDVMMPDIDGFETCARLKQNPAHAEIPVIFTTSLTESIHKVTGLQLGAVDYITKPFDLCEVIARINLQLKIYRLNHQLRQEIHEKRQAEVALQTLNLELEQRVEKRTAQLKLALQELQQAQVRLLEREQQLEYEVYHDSLTGLPNRAWCIHQLNQMIKRYNNNPNDCYAVLFLDLDRFKVVNDSLGHLLGDQLLKQVALRLQSCLNQDSHVVRLGGDEFIILMDRIRAIEEAIALAQKILEELIPPFRVDHYEVYSSASIGITFSQLGYHQPEEILRDADVAMYSAKANGKGCYQVLNPEIQQKAITRLQLENDLRRAIQNQEFSLYYQPIISLTHPEQLGFEALIRWEHPQKGLISPNQFISVAEETGLIIDLGWWVLQTALKQIHDWQRQFSYLPELTININVSPLQLLQAGFWQQLQEMIWNSGVNPHSLKLEITESCLLKTVSSQEVDLLKRLKNLGVQLCIDDFGTGYSSLSRLHRFPIDTLKIDRSFVRQIGSNQGEIELIQTIIMLAHGLGMDVVAEGIETKAQLNQLCLLGCEWGQGFLFSKPLNQAEASDYLSSIITTQWQQKRVKV